MTGELQSGYVAIALCGLWSTGTEFPVRAEDADAVIDALRKRGFAVVVHGRWDDMPNGVATVGGYPTGRDSAADCPEPLRSRMYMMFERTAPPARC